MADRHPLFYALSGNDYEINKQLSSVPGLSCLFSKHVELFLFSTLFFSLFFFCHE